MREREPGNFACFLRYLVDRNTKRMRGTRSLDGWCLCDHIGMQVSKKPQPKVRRSATWSLIVLGLFFCMFRTERALARVTLQPCKNNVSTQQQIEIGQKAAAQVFQQMPVLPDSSPITQYVQTLGQKLVAHAPGYRQRRYAKIDLLAHHSAPRRRPGPV